ncbi:hypothetical protein [Streptomyces sp. NPDC051909]|uniref:hypothetical protein n=1 Tax=Streptomyces sp. NPDC051909 TaxID=3154944 RepID=UPI00343B6929
MPRWAVVLLWVTGAVIVLVPVGLMAGFMYVYGKNHEGMRFPSDDATVTMCRLDPVSKRPVAELSVTSQAAHRGTYRVTVEFRDDRGKAVEQGVGTVEDLPRGATGRAVVVGVKAYGAGAPKCVVYDAEFRSTEPASSTEPSATAGP